MHLPFVPYYNCLPFQNPGVAQIRVVVWTEGFSEAFSNMKTSIPAITLSLVLLACRSDNRNAGDVLKMFVDEFYSGQAQSNFTAVVNKYTDWPDFVVGNATQIAKERDMRLVTENGDEARFEVRFKVIGEENLAKVELGDTEVVQTYRLRRRRGQWRILQPIHIPCVSVEGELTRLKAAIENASDRIAKKDFTETATREHFETLIANAQASIALLERYR
jgi:hypothetical protein